MLPAHYAVGLICLHALIELTVRGELQISALENSALKDRFGRLERQYSELQDLASAYSEVIRGFSPAHGQTVSIDQLQAEAGRDGLRAKALEADVLRPLIREVGGLQALISQIQTMKTLIHNAGGLRELEKFVSDLHTIRDTLHEFRGPRGLDGLVPEVRELLKSQQEHAALKSRVDGPNGLEVKAARYDKLIQAFTDVQRGTVAASVMMNPARARLISETPFEADPDRDLYEGPQPVAKPLNKTGSNNTPLGTPQVQAIAQPASQATGSSTLKRESADIAPSVSAKRPRVDIGRASAMVHASLIATNAPATGLKTRAQSRHVESEGTVLKDGGSGLRAQTATAPPKMSDWMRTDVRFGSVGFTPKFGTRIPTHSSPPPSEPHADTRSAPTRFAPTNSSSLVTRSAAEWGSLAKEPTVAQARVVSANSLESRHMNYPVAFLVYRPDAITNWKTYPISDLKRIPEVPHDLFTFVVGEFSRHVPIAKAAEFHTMGPGMKTCIIR